MPSDEMALYVHTACEKQEVQRYEACVSKIQCRGAEISKRGLAQETFGSGKVTL